MWDERYSKDGYVYGTAPNDFVREAFGVLESPVLCVASGEGRNPVWLAGRGLEVHAVDGSAIGVEKTRRLAAERGLVVHATHADLAEFDLGDARWGGIVATFAHLPPPLRAKVHAGMVRALRPGGVLLLEGYTPRQLDYRTGGPPVMPMLFEPADLRVEFAGLDFERCDETVRPVIEGWAHTGDAAVVQIIARKPR